MSKWTDLARALADLLTNIPSFGKPRELDSARPSVGIGDLSAAVKNGRLEAWKTQPGPPPIQGIENQPDLLDAIARVKNKYKDFLPDKGEDDFDQIDIFGRDASYADDLMDNVKASEVRVVSSSNVYSYSWEDEGDDPRKGILYVTYLEWYPGMKNSERSGPGATYAYYDFPRERFEDFESRAEESAGKAVWDYCRVRGTQHGHQHRYRLISISGKYVPRKATAKGFKDRTLIQPGLSPHQRRTLYKIARLFSSDRSELRNPSGFLRSTLGSTGKPNRAKPNRGRPDRGTPNRGQ